MNEFDDRIYRVDGEIYRPPILANGEPYYHEVYGDFRVFRD